MRRSPDRTATPSRKRPSPSDLASNRQARERPSHWRRASAPSCDGQRGDASDARPGLNGLPVVTAAGKDDATVDKSDCGAAVRQASERADVSVEGGGRRVTRRVHGKQRTSGGNDQPRLVMARSSGAGASSIDGAVSSRSLGRNAPSIGGVVIEASPRPSHLSQSLPDGLHRRSPQYDAGPVQCGSAPSILIRPMRLLVTPPR